MISRYSLPEMSAIWSLENKYRLWLEVEILACEAWVELGVLPADDVKKIREKATFNVERIEEIEADTNHDVVAFTRAVSESLGDESKWVHYGLTSTDVVDTALSACIVQAHDLIAAKLAALRDVTAALAGRHRHTLMMGRTHGVHAEPTTFGLKLAVWVAELDRHLVRLGQLRQDMAVGKLSGAVGTYANTPPFVEEYVCERMGLTPAIAATQTLQRDRHAHFTTTLAVLGATLEKMATEVRALQKTETREVEEPFRTGQKGSSSMPHKRNPIMCERVAGMARLLRGYAVAAMENVALWHERDISHSSVERVILPDATHTIYYMLYVMVRVMTDLRVFPDNMRANMARSYELPFSQHVLLKLIDSGLTREKAYDLVQRLAMRSWNEGLNFRELVMADAEISSRVSPEDIARCFDVDYHLKHINVIFARLGI
ncbi:MAG TPA: adenylosuccinate lyase [Bacillota bacterium]|nr:adenylosuccinate lyase [Bacillota bacterium]